MRKQDFPRQYFNQKEMECGDSIRETPETDYTIGLKSINQLMNGAGRSLGRWCGLSEMSKQWPPKGKLIQCSFSPVTVLSLSVCPPPLTEQQSGAASAGLMEFKSQLNYSLAV